MAERLQGHAPATWVNDAKKWDFDCINERFRFCRYAPSQQFHIHQDGVFHRLTAPEGARSFLTFMIYLNDGDEFVGGDTLFYADGLGATKNTDGDGLNIIARVRPQVGSLILFDHSVWHAGEMVTAGVKHIMRSDVLYKPTCGTMPVVTPAAPSSAFTPAHQGYIWTLTALQRIEGDALASCIASGGRDKVIRLWSAQGAPMQALHGHTQSVLGLAPLLEGKLASVSRDRSLKIWNIATGQCAVSVAAHESAVLCVCAFVRDTEQRIATGGADSQVKLWNTEGVQQSTLNGHTGWVWDIAPMVRAGEGATVSEDGDIATVSEDGDIAIWNTLTLQRTHRLAGNVPLRTLVVAENGRIIISGDMNGNILMWVLKDRHWRVTASIRAHTAAVRRLRLLSPILLASAGEDNQLRLWRIEAEFAAEFALVAQAAFSHSNFVTDAMAVDGGCLSCSYDGEIKKWQC